MAKLNCLCGNYLSNSQSPSEIVGWLLTDEDMQDTEEDMTNGECREDFSIAVMDHSRNVWECWECGRLAFSYPDKDDCAVKWYKPEDGQAGFLMSPRATKVEV